MSFSWRDPFGVRETKVDPGLAAAIQEILRKRNWKATTFEESGIQRPEYETFLDTAEGEDGKSQYALRDNDKLKSNYDSTYEEYLANYAKSQVASPWLNAQNDLLEAENQVDRELETRNRASQMTKAQDAMSMGGGDNSGSAEMLAGQGVSAKVAGGQAVQDKYNQGKLGALQAEQEDKRGTGQYLSQFAPGVAQYKTSLNQGNIGTILDERSNAYDESIAGYDTQMGIWSSEKLADSKRKRA